MKLIQNLIDIDSYSHEKKHMKLKDRHRKVGLPYDTGPWTPFLFIQAPVVDIRLPASNPGHGAVSMGRLFLTHTHTTQMPMGEL